jgi:hypothetical protein
MADYTKKFNIKTGEKKSQIRLIDNYTLTALTFPETIQGTKIYIWGGEDIKEVKQIINPADAEDAIIHFKADKFACMDKNDLYKVKYLQLEIDTDQQQDTEIKLHFSMVI